MVSEDGTIAIISSNLVAYKLASQINLYAPSSHDISRSCSDLDGTVTGDQGI